MKEHNAYPTFRSIFKWGDKREETLEPAMKQLLSEKFNLNETALKPNNIRGEEQVSGLPEPQLSEEQLKALKQIVGEAHVDTTESVRAAHAYGKFYTELLRLRLQDVSNPPDAVVYPLDEATVKSLINFCNTHGIAITPFGGGSSVTRGVATPQRGLSLNFTRNMNSIGKINKANNTITVQPGVYGPELEQYLNANHYTCGHFPQSFEYSTVGGWVAARGAGQASTGYGKIEDMVVAMRVVTPSGIVATKDYPRMAQGWNLHEPFIGSEGSLGIITEITLKIHKYQPRNTRKGAFLFKNFEEGVKAMQQVMQGEFGKPHLFRLSDPEETEIAFKIQGFDGNFQDKILHKLGYSTGKRCLMFATVEGAKQYARTVMKKITHVATQHRALPLGQGPVRKWLKQRFESAYLRDPLMDAGLITDTLETAVTWENLYNLWHEVHKYLKSRPKTIAMTHISHVYENGANLYFTFISPADLKNPVQDYEQYHKGLIDNITANNGSLSHHHGIGRTLSPWLHTQYSRHEIAFMQAIKQHFDPNNIMNPGAVIPEFSPYDNQ